VGGEGTCESSPSVSSARQPISGASRLGSRNHGSPSETEPLPPADAVRWAGRPPTKAAAAAAGLAGLKPGRKRNPAALPRRRLRTCISIEKCECWHEHSSTPNRDTLVCTCVYSIQRCLVIAMHAVWIYILLPGDGNDHFTWVHSSHGTHCGHARIYRPRAKIVAPLH
jgi:hypothetical protein